MSNSCELAGVRQRPWVLTAKYTKPSVGSSPLDASCGALEVAPNRLRSADRSSGKLTHPLVMTSEQLGARPLVPCSSRPATVDWTFCEPLPWLTDWPVSGSSEVSTSPAGRVTWSAWLIAEAGRGAEYTGTRRSGPSLGSSTSKPLASDWNCRGTPPWSACTVESFVLTIRLGSSVRVTVTSLLERASSETEDG